jgi:hypothetical protein
VIQILTSTKGFLSMERNIMYTMPLWIAIPNADAIRTLDDVAPLARTVSA